MASLTPKTLKGRTYYYARECQRVNGKPKIVKTVYLGSLDHIIQAVTHPQEPLRPQTVRLASFGDVAALFDQACQIGLIELIDAQIPKRDQGLSVGQYLLLAAINRAAPPSSKAQLAHWYHRTVLPRLLPATPPPPANSPAKPSGTTWTVSPKRTSPPSSRRSPSDSSANSTCPCAPWSMTAPTSSPSSSRAPALSRLPESRASSGYPLGSTGTKSSLHARRVVSQ